MGDEPDPHEACPAGHTNTRVTATVSVGRWERRFYECAVCHVDFEGTWYSADAIRSASVIDRRAPSEAPSLQSTTSAF